MSGVSLCRGLLVGLLYIRARSPWAHGLRIGGRNIGASLCRG